VTRRVSRAPPPGPARHPPYPAAPTAGAVRSTRRIESGGHRDRKGGQGHNPVRAPGTGGPGAAGRRRIGSIVDKTRWVPRTAAKDAGSPSASSDLLPSMGPVLPREGVSAPGTRSSHCNPLLYPQSQAARAVVRAEGSNGASSAYSGPLDFDELADIIRWVPMPRFAPFVDFRPVPSAGDGARAGIVEVSAGSSPRRAFPPRDGSGGV